MKFLTDDQIALLKEQGIRVNLLSTWYLDEGTYNFCDHVDDLTDGTTTWTGASALFSATEITGDSSLAAEGCQIVIDGNRIYDASGTDPAFIFNGFMEMNYQQRRVDLAYSFAPMNLSEIQLVVQIYAGKINYAVLTNSDFNGLQPSGGVNDILTIYLDSLAARYQTATGRTRSNDDQLEIDPDDQFFAYVGQLVQNEFNMFWGKAVPAGATSPFSLGKVMTAWTSNND